MRRVLVFCLSFRAAISENELALGWASASRVKSEAQVVLRTNAQSRDEKTSNFNLLRVDLDPDY
jgi:hypothetical protein